MKMNLACLHMLKERFTLISMKFVKKSKLKLIDLVGKRFNNFLLEVFSIYYLIEYLQSTDYFENLFTEGGDIDINRFTWLNKSRKSRLDDVIIDLS